MNRKITKIWGISLIMVMLVSLLAVALPVSADTLEFAVLAGSDIPTDTGKKLITDGYGIYDLAVSADGETIYAVTSDGAGTGVFYKSTNGGSTWATVSVSAGSAGSLADISHVAMAPDDSAIIAVAGDNDEVYLSTNGGSTFSLLNSAAGTITDGADTLLTTAAIQDLAISGLDSGKRYIAVAGVSANATSATSGCLFYFDYGSAAPVWSNAAGAKFTGEASNVASYYAVAFSPNFSSDLVMTTVSGNTTNGLVRFHIASFNQKTWDAAVFDNYPKTIVTVTGALVVNAADISLDPNYLAGDDTTRIAMVGIAATDDSVETGGLYRLKDTTLAELKADTGINSVAWDGTNLVAGAYADNNVYRSADALASSGWTVSTSKSYKEIGVDDASDDMTIVAWAGTDVVGAKRGAAAAFSRSTDNGANWNDLSLVSGALTTLLDVYVSPDASLTYLVSRDAGETSLWRQADSDWTRVFCTANITNNYIVRAADGSPATVYVAMQGASAQTLYYSTNGGVSKWTQRSSPYNIADIAVQDESIAYIANYANDEVSKTTNGGFTWGSDKDTTIDQGTCRTITLIGEDQILVGTSTGYIGYSSDGNSSWSNVKYQLNVSGNTHVTADGLADGNFIYAATDGASSRVERWEIGQSSTKWKNLEAETGATGSTEGIYGLVLRDGALYAMGANSANSTLMRTIEPTTSTPASSKWSEIASTGQAYNKTPSSMRVAGGIVYAIDNVGEGLWTMTDAVAPGLVIALVSPANGFKNPINPVNGNSQDIAFRWTKPTTTGDLGYQVKIYASDGATTLLTATVTLTDLGTPSVVIGPNQTTNKVTFAPGETYYWKVRTYDPVYSPYSEIRSFTIQPLGAQVSTIGSPVNGATITNLTPAFSWSPVGNATKYEFQLAMATSFSSPVAAMEVASTGVRPLVKLEAGMTYFWRVRAIAPVQGEWSSISNFMVAEPAPAPTPPVVIQQMPAPVINIPAAPPAQQIVIPPAPTPPAPIAPAYIWAIIIIGAVLVIAVIVLIVRTRRTV